VRRFRRNRRGSAAVEFALVAPVFFALLFAIIESAMVFFAARCSRLASRTAGGFSTQVRTSVRCQFKQDFCNRVGALFPCDSLDLCLDVRRYAPGTVITLNDPIDGGGN